MQKIFILTLLIFVTSIAYGQRKKKKADDTDPGFRNELSIGAGVHTRGWTYTSIQYGLIRKPQRTMFFNLDFAELKSGKERRRNYNTLSLVGNSPKSFIYGKRSNFYALRVGYGEKYYISKKSKRGISLAFTYSGGISLGMIKPYYLDLIYRVDNQAPYIRSEAYNSENHFKFLDPREIDGASGFTHGWDDLSLAVGGFVKTGIIFDWGAYDKIIKTMEIGICFDFFFQKIPIMVSQENAPIFANIYMNFNFGRRW